MNAAVDLSEPPRIPAPPEFVARAEALVKEYGIACFWFRHPEAKVRFIDDVRLVVHHHRDEQMNDKRTLSGKSPKQFRHRGMPGAAKRPDLIVF